MEQLLQPAIAAPEHPAPTAPLAPENPAAERKILFDTLPSILQILLNILEKALVISNWPKKEKK